MGRCELWTTSRALYGAHTLLQYLGDFDTIQQLQDDGELGALLR